MCRKLSHQTDALYEYLRRNKGLSIHWLKLSLASPAYFNQEGKTPMDLVLQWQNGTKELFNSLKDNSYKSVHLNKF